MVHPDDRPPSEAVGRTLHEGLPAEWEFRIIRPNGRVRWISTRSELLMDSEGRPVRSVGVSFDVTKRHEVLQSLDIASGQPGSFDQSCPGYRMVRRQERTHYQVDEVRGHGIGRPIGRQSEPWTDLFHPDEQNSVEGVWRQAALSRTPYRFEHRIRQRDGSYRWARTLIVPVFSRRGEPLELIGLSIDVENEKRYSPNAADPGTSPALKYVRHEGCLHSR